MKPETILTLVGIGAGAYVLLSAKEEVKGVVGGVSNAVQGAGQGVNDALTGAGQGINIALTGAGESVKEIVQGASSPWEFLDTFLETKNQDVKQEQAWDIPYDKQQNAFKEERKSTSLRGKLDREYIQQDYKTSVYDVAKQEQFKRKSLRQKNRTEWNEVFTISPSEVKSGFNSMKNFISSSYKKIRAKNTSSKGSAQIHALPKTSKVIRKRNSYSSVNRTSSNKRSYTPKSTSLRKKVSSVATSTRKKVSSWFKKKLRK